MTKEFFERGKQIAKWADNNMTKDEALKMAIEALEITDEAFTEFSKGLVGLGIPASILKLDKQSRLIPAIQACKEALETPECNPHPKAPHGFNRNASHSAGRYVCECEGWELEWQGLTSEEIESLDLDNDVISVIFQTEKLLKEKDDAM